MIRAVDTNVLLRYITLDDAIHSPIALAVMQQDEILILPTVLIETEWVLRSFYKWTRAEIAKTLSLLISLENVVVRNEPQMRWALVQYGQGADLPDLIHVIIAPPAQLFSTFDKGLKTEANLGMIPVEVLA